MSAGGRLSGLVRFVIASLAIWAALALSTPAVAAQTVLTCSVSGQSGKCSPTVTLDQPATMVNPALLQLSVSPTSSTYTAATTDMDQATGVATFTPVSLSVMANRSWTLQVNANFAFCDGHVKAMRPYATNPDPTNRPNDNLWDARRN